MKNKAGVSFLVLVVVVVWGLIIYRVVSAASDEDARHFTIQPTVPKEPLNDYALVKDTATLRLNYRDPFSQDVQKDTAELPVSQLTAHQPLLPVPKALSALPQKPVVNWNLIRYAGFIRNPHTKKLLALLSIGGKSLMLSEGEAADQVKLLKNLKDSVRITYQNQTRYIRLSTQPAP